jgi:hypothetical protein
VAKTLQGAVLLEERPPDGDETYQVSRDRVKTAEFTIASAHGPSTVDIAVCRFFRRPVNVRQQRSSTHKEVLKRSEDLLIGSLLRSTLLHREGRSISNGQLPG